MRVVIIANGENFSNPILEEKIEQTDCIIAADGGVYNCIANNIIPDYIIGDIDSFLNTEKEISKKTKVIRIEEQETTDMQKALSFAKTLKPSQIDIFCSFGKRTDHSLGNILILNNFSSVPTTMYDEYGFFKMISAGDHSFNNKKDKTISLFTISNLTNIKLQGFEYPLTEKTIGPAFIGVSNKIAKEKASIKFDDGKLLIYELYD